MQIAMLTCGTRGDTQPMTVLAAELRRRGHQVRLAVSPNTMDLPRACGFDTVPLGPDSRVLMESEQGRRWLASGDVKAFVRELADLSHQSFPDTAKEVWEAGDGADLVVAGILAEDLADAVAEFHGVPLVTLHNAPLRRTRAYPHPLVTTAKLPSPLNAVTGALFERVWWQGMRADIESFRGEHGLPPARRPTPARLERTGSLELQAYDRAVVPGLGWGERRPLVGFLTLDDELRAALGENGLPDGLSAWLDDGEAPVFFGFGRMPVRDPAATVDMITGVARTLGVRALVSAGWGGLAALDPDDPDVLVVGGVDHDAVLPRCAAAVHHGGAGTTATGLAAGLPTVVCSVFADQPFWGRRLVDLGVGAHVRFADLDAAGLQNALRTVLAEDVRRRAGDLGRRLLAPHEAAALAADAVETQLALRA
jgi:UDP:flavonoid glycosyltransferase YjiC (YdhE family)